MQATQILEDTYFTRCMSQAYPLEIPFNNAIPIVSDTDQAQSTATDFNPNITCPCIQCILYEFFDDRDRALNDLTSCNAFCNLRRQLIQWSSFYRRYVLYL